jgi:hypothetical protein
VLIVPGVSAATYTVPGDYATLQAAINAASDGDTISITDDIDDYDVRVNVTGLTFSGNGYNINSTGANWLFYVTVNNTSFEDIAFSGDLIIILWGDSESADTLEGLSIDNCSFIQTTNYGGGVGRAAVDVEHGGSIGGLTITNCNFTYGTDEVGLVLMTWLHPLLYDIWIENCTMIDGTEFVDINDDTSNVTIINNICHSSTVDGYWVAFYWGAHDGITITGNYFYDADPADVPDSNIYLNLDDGGITNFNCTKNFYEDYTGYDTDMDGYGNTPYNLTADGAYSDTAPIAINYALIVSPFTIVSIYPLYSGAWDSATEVLSFIATTSCTVSNTGGYHHPYSCEGSLGSISSITTSSDVLTITGILANETMTLTYLFPGGIDWDIDGDVTAAITWDWRTGRLIFTGCGDIAITSPDGFPSGSFKVEVAGAVWSLWSFDGTTITINDVPCNSEVVVDFKVDEEDVDGTPEPEIPAINGTSPPPIPSMPTIPGIDPVLLWLGISWIIIIIGAAVGYDLYARNGRGASWGQRNSPW